MCQLQHAIGVEPVAGSPVPPAALDALGGVDQDAVEVEQDGGA
jgi:hypothetical protein